MAEIENTSHDRCNIEKTGEVPSFCYHNSKLIEDFGKRQDKFDDELRRIEKKFDEQVDHLEYKMDSRLQKMELSMAEMDKGYAVLSERNTAALESLTTMVSELSDGNRKMENTMSSMNSTMSALAKQITGVETKVESFEVHTSQNIHQIEKEIHEVDDKGKMDIVEMIREQAKNKIAPYLIGGGVVAAAFTIILKVLGLV